MNPLPTVNAAARSPGAGDAALALVLVLLCAGLASLLVWFSTRWGIGTSPDSVQYLLGARALLAGGSPLELPRQWPPLYPLVLAAAGWLSGDVFSGARVLHAALFGLNTLLFAALAWQQVRDAHWSARVACAAAFCLSPALYIVHFMAWSESLFLTLLLGHWLLLLRGHGRSLPALASAGLCLGCAMLTRYAGIAFLVTSVVWLLVAGGTRRRALAEAATVLGAAVPLPAGWTAWIVLGGVAAAPRPLVVHPITLDYLHQAGQTLSGWAHVSAWGVPGAALLLAVSAFVIVAAAWPGGPRARAPRMLLGAVVGYLLFLVTSVSLFDHYTPLDVRILVPAQVMLLTALACCAGRVAPARGAVAILLMAMYALGGIQELRSLLQMHTRFGYGYLSPLMAQEKILDVVRAIDPRLAIRSNAPELIRLLLARDAEMLPVTRDKVRDRSNANFDAEFARLLQDVRGGRAVAVSFSAFAWRDYVPPVEELQRQGLPVIYQAADGAVFGAPSRAAPP